jgi:hypothetical protein
MSKSELAASHHELKEQLHKDSDEIKNQIRDELHGVTDQFKDFAASAALIGGSAVIGYWLVQKLGPWKPKRIGAHRSRIRKAGESLMKAVILNLLAIARDKLVEYLETMEDETEDLPQDAAETNH